MEAGDEPFHEFILPEKPPGSIREAGRDAADDPADGDIRTEALSVACLVTVERDRVIHPLSLANDWLNLMALR